MTKGTPRSPKLAADNQAHLGDESVGWGNPLVTRLPEPQVPADEALALEAARYIEQMSAELASIARSAHLDLLAYFLEMARLEATNSIRKLET